jgi:hypothetical protein
LKSAEKNGFRLTPLDAGLAILAIGAFVASVSLAHAKTGEPKVIIEGEKQQWVYSLDDAVRIDVKGPLGTTIVEIGGGFVHIDYSPCSNQICVASGGIRLPGSWIACLPNRVFVRIEGSNVGTGEIDAVVK